MNKKSRGAIGVGVEQLGVVVIADDE